MMKILAALVIISVAAGVTPAKKSTCRNQINCPCGSTGKNVKVCLQEEKQGDPCSRWSRCKTCQDGLDGCLECTDGLEGQFCSRVGNVSLSRQKRQYYYHPHRGTRPRQQVSSSYQQSPGPQSPSYGYPTYPVRQGGGPCSELNSPKLGSIRCEASDRQTICVGKCLPGYRFEGHDSAVQMTLTCRGGYYTPLSSFPPCKSGGHCNLVVEGSGSFNCTTGMKGTQCDVICNGRYAGRYFCYPGQNWDPPLPRCVVPKEVEDNPRACECEYGGSCDSNGVCVCPVGRTGRFCEEFVPKLHTCSDPGFVVNGIRKNPDMSIADARRTFEEGESVVYSCVSGQYALSGSPLLKCEHGGLWSSPLPKCVRTTVVSPTRFSFCRDPGVDPNGSRKPTSPPSRQGFPQGSQLQFYCNEGYDLTGEKSIFCLTSGVWSARIPSCSRQSREPADIEYCVNPGPILNGRIMYYPPLNSRRRGEPQTILEDPEYPRGSLLRYSCDIGYILDGSDTLTCGENGEWSDEPPICRGNELPYCLNPGDIANGRIEYHPPLNNRRGGDSATTVDDPEFPMGGVLRYYCDRGFILEGSDSLTCENTGIWSSEPPICRRDSPDRSNSFCRDPGVDPNGRRNPRIPPNRQGFPHGTFVEFFCNQGYELDGEQKIFCLSGEWLSERPKCSPMSRDAGGTKYCPHPGSISNGRAAYFPPTNARLGRQTVTNLENPEFPEGSRLQYSCNSGYRLQGSDSLVCQASGGWSAEPPVCRRAATGSIRYCLNPGPVTNGKVEHVPALNERRPGSPDLEDEDDEFVEYPQASRLVYSCDRGFTLQGSANLTCEATGRWSADPPTCVTKDVKHLMYCINPGPVRNGRIRYRFPLALPRAGSTSLVAEDTPEYPEGTILEYLCDDGYLTEGSVTLKCDSTGKWSALPPKCNPDCGRSIMGTTHRIKNGNKTIAGEWPWVVAIAVLSNTNFPRLICGGAVLNPRTVITAAHCVNKNSRFVLYFGKYFSRFDLDDDKVENRTTDTVIIHPDFNNVTMDSDIALITFRPRIKYSPVVQPICLPSTDSTLRNLAQGMKGYVTGWGYTERRLGSDALLMAHLPFVTESDCLQSLNENAPNFQAVLTQNMFCAGYKQANQTTCRGDSGSPLVFYNPLTERYTLEGLVSFTVEGQCGLPGIYSVFTKVYKYLFWILSNSA